MKVLMLNGSPHAKGATYLALHEMQKVFNMEGIDTEIIDIGSMPIAGCMACGGCFKTGRCVNDDIVNEVLEKFEECDGLVIGSPVYYASMNGTLSAFLDRLFFASRFDKTMKVGAAVTVARRGGLTAAFDQINKYFTISGMPVASGQYWNGMHGWQGDRAQIYRTLEDEEGAQQMRTVARNMTFLMKSIELGKKEFGLPEKEKRVGTNFIR